MNVEIEGFKVTGLKAGDPVSINIVIGGGGNPDDREAAAINLTDDFQAPIERPGNITDTGEDIVAEQNEEFTRQFAAKLADSPSLSDIALDAVEKIAGDNDAVN